MKKHILIAFIAMFTMLAANAQQAQAQEVSVQSVRKQLSELKKSLKDFDRSIAKKAKHEHRTEHAHMVKLFWTHPTTYYRVRRIKKNLATLYALPKINDLKLVSHTLSKKEEERILREMGEELQKN